MAIDTFIAEVWSARLLRLLEPRLVMTQPRVMNRNWEGEIADKGDTVHIRAFTTGGSIYPYTRNTQINGGTPDRPDDDSLTLLIDQAKAFYIAVDDVDKAQADLPIMDKFLARTARNLAVELDTHAADLFVAGVVEDNRIGSPDAPVTIRHDADGVGELTPHEFCVEARKRLQKQGTPGDDRWMVVDADLEAQFLLDPQFTRNLADVSVVRHGQIGRCAGFDILTTEAVSRDETSGGSPEQFTNIIYGDGNYSLTWADQIIKVEAERLQGEFSDAIKGLNVFGAKIIEAESYGVAHAQAGNAA